MQRFLGEAGRVFAVVADQIRNLAEQSAKNLSRTTELQAESMEQAEAGVNRIFEIVEANSATAEETSATSEELSAQANTMDDLVGQFKLRE